MTVMKEKVATRMAAHDSMKTMWVLSAINHKETNMCCVVFLESKKPVKMPQQQSSIPSQNVPAYQRQRNCH